MRPSLEPLTDQPPSPDPSPLDALLAAGPEELVVDHPTTECPEPRQAGTLGEEHGPLSFINQVREAAEASLYYFNLVFMGGHTLMQPGVQGAYCNFLQATPPFRKLLLAPRGTLKTTITKGLCLHLLIQPAERNRYFPHGRIGYLNHAEGRSTRILLASRGAKLSQEKLIELRTQVETSQLLRAFWPACFWQEPRRQATAWNNERLFFPRRDIFKEGSIETAGVDASITGSHYNVGLYDDLVGEEDRFSATVMERIYNWVSAIPALLDDRDRHAHEIFLGTHWSNNDIYVRLKREDHTLVHLTYSAIKENGEALWPEVLDLERLSIIQADLESKGKGDLYALNYLNDPHHLSIMAFDLSQVRYWREESEEWVMEEDGRDFALIQDFLTGKPPSPLHDRGLRGTRLTPETYKQHRSEIREGLKAVWMKERSKGEERGERG